jgi:diguanylate cyclase (GGDEF)-like protein
VDVDDFKLYNDLHRHQKGDDCLRAVAGAMAKNALRPADVSARHGGEEFAVLMPDADHEVALKIGQRLRDSISRLRLTHGAPEAGALVTISIGVATQVPQENAHPEFLLARADQAPYAAKHTGRNRVVSADKALAAFKTSQPETKARVRVAKR